MLVYVHAIRRVRAWGSADVGALFCDIRSTVGLYVYSISRTMVAGGFKRYLTAFNPKLCQVGRMLVSGSGLRAAAGKRMVAVELLHCVGDLLWALTPGRPLPNGGFTGEEVQPWSDDGDGDGDGDSDDAALASGELCVRASPTPVAGLQASIWSRT